MTVTTQDNIAKANKGRQTTHTVIVFTRDALIEGMTRKKSGSVCLFVFSLHGSRKPVMYTLIEPGLKPVPP